MARSRAAVVRRLPGCAPAARAGVASRPPEPPTAPPISNARLAVVTLLVAETMFFSGLIGAYLVFRGSAPVWPPADLPQPAAGGDVGRTRWC